ncbi:MAG: hypothetical protein WHV66_14210, partial [Anaerolineales bacterium]
MFCLDTFFGISGFSFGPDGLLRPVGDGDFFAGFAGWDTVFFSLLPRVRETAAPFFVTVVCFRAVCRT